MPAPPHGRKGRCAINSIPLARQALAALTLEPFLPGDVTCDGFVYPVDLTVLLGEWGPCEAFESCASDFVSSQTFRPPADGKVDGADLAVLLGNWGS